MDSLLPKETLGFTRTRGILGAREPFISGKQTLGEDTNANTFVSVLFSRQLSPQTIVGLLF